MKAKIIVFLCIILSIDQVKGTNEPAGGNTAMQNVPGRSCTSLNGMWDVLPDPSGIGSSRHWERIVAPRNKSHLVELKYEGLYKLYVPGDWNYQYPEFKFYQGDMWYKREFSFTPRNGSRTFLHFGAVSQNCSVFLNGELIGKHQGGFTPFQFEITDRLIPDVNVLVVRVDNRLSETGIPAKYFDWWNYGGITRDVNILSVPQTFIEDYNIQLSKGSLKEISARIRLDGKNTKSRKITLSIPEIKIKKELTTDEHGEAVLAFNAKPELWYPENPKLYEITLSTGEDRISDRIGFRCIQVQGEDILLNGKKIFMYGINFHEEIACRERRACSIEDARYLLGKARETGANFIRLAHYPQNEYTVRLAEEMGFMLWEEIPVWQGIRFSDPEVCGHARQMMKEMVSRDKNRCAVVIWSISNETSSRDDNRNRFLPELASYTRELDPTRLVSSALDAVFARKDGDGLAMGTSDSLTGCLDVIGVNKYMGWYRPFPCEPKELNWKVSPGKPVLITEFGAEATYGNHGDADDINSWSEEYMADVYENNLASFKNPNNIRGIAPWILFDFRSPGRSNALHQQGWNKKGLLSNNGDRKKAWYIIHDAYSRRIFDEKIK